MDTLQWQIYPVSNSTESVQHRRYGRRSSSSNRNFIRENIESLRYCSRNKKDLQTKPNGNLRPISHNMQGYFDNIESNQNQFGASLSDVSTGRSIQQKQSILPRDLNTSIPSVSPKDANAEAVSVGNFPDRRSTNNKPKLSLSSDRLNLGKLPPYLIRRRKEEAARIAAEKATEGREQTPDGHRRVSEEERVNTLQSLEEVYSKTIGEFNRVSLSADTSRAQKQRTDLEHKLSDLEEVMGAFRKPVVFIKLD